MRAGLAVRARRGIVWRVAGRIDHEEAARYADEAPGAAPKSG